jgi:hypothetical protein
VPVQALSEKGGSSSVMVVNADGQLEERRVEIGLETPDLVEVKSNLRDGELVVIGNRSSLKPGTRVEAKLMDRPSAQRVH